MKVFVLGSSMTIQFGPYLEKALEGSFEYDRKRNTDTERAEDDLDKPKGASAGDSSMVLEYLRKRRQENPIAADILLLSCGLHDMRRDVKTGEYRISPDKFESNLPAIIEEVNAMNLTLVWLRIPPVFDAIHNSRAQAFRRYQADVDAYNAIADRIMNENDVRMIDIHQLCVELGPSTVIDHIHYDETARERQAVFIAEKLREMFLPEST